LPQVAEPCRNMTVPKHLVRYQPVRGRFRTRLWDGKAAVAASPLGGLTAGTAGIAVPLGGGGRTSSGMPTSPDNLLQDPSGNLDDDRQNRDDRFPVDLGSLAWRLAPPASTSHRWPFSRGRLSRLRDDRPVSVVPGGRLIWIREYTKARLASNTDVAVEVARRVACGSLRPLVARTRPGLRPSTGVGTFVACR
jgi:hypothetical protein